MVHTVDTAADDIRVDEIRRQLKVLTREKWPRIALTTLAFALSTVFLPVWVFVLVSIVNLLGELAALRLMQGLNPARDPRSYRLSMAAVFLIEAAYTLTAGAVWVQDTPHSQAFALGMVMITLIHLSTVRAIHLPYGLAGFSAVLLAILICNTAFWMPRGDWDGLLFSTICAAGGLTYTLTAMLSNNDLHRSSARSEAAAQAADSEKSRFLAQMSHELRTPLNAIIGLGLAERDRASDPISQARLGTVVDSARGLATILDDILDLSAIGAGRFPLREQDFALAPEVEKITALFAEQFRSAGIALESRIDPGLPDRIRLDPQRMRQCITNLTSNALRHSGGHRVSLTVGQAPATPGVRPMLRIVVADDGRGIPEAERARLFEPFRQGPDAQGGTGLGLAICRAMARQMGGELTVLPGTAGARFQLDLAFSAAMSSQADATPPAMPDLAGRTILIVDDIATNRMVAATFLASSGARTLEAAGGAAALALLEQGPVDLVLLDMNMPHMDGLETFRRIRGMAARFLRLPIIAMTADAAGDHRRHYLAQGLDDHLAKPIDPESLALVLNRHLRA